MYFPVQDTDLHGRIYQPPDHHARTATGSLKTQTTTHAPQTAQNSEPRFAKYSEETYIHVYPHSMSLVVVQVAVLRSSGVRV